MPFKRPPKNFAIVIHSLLLENFIINTEIAVGPVELNFSQCLFVFFSFIIWYSTFRNYQNIFNDLKENERIFHTINKNLLCFFSVHLLLSANTRFADNTKEI